MLASVVRAVLAVLLAAVSWQVVESSCPVQGCQTNHNFAINLKETATAKLGWKSSLYRPSTAGCVSVSDQVACPTCNRLIVFDVDGNEQWKSAASYSASSSLPVYTANNAALFYSGGFNYSSHFVNGTLRFAVETHGGGTALGSTVVGSGDGETVALSEDGGGFLMIDRRMNELFVFDDGDGYVYVAYSQPVAGRGSTAYVITYAFPYESAADRWPGHRLIAVDVMVHPGPEFNATRRTVHEVSFEGYDSNNPWADPAILFADDVIYFRFRKFEKESHRDYLFAVRDVGEGGGTQLWNASFPTGASIQYMAFSDHGHKGLIVAFEEDRETRINVLSPSTGSLQRVVRLSDSAIRLSAPLFYVRPPSDSGDGALLVAFEAESPGVALISLETGDSVWSLPSPDGSSVLGQMAPTGDDGSGAATSIVCTTNTTLFSILLQ